MYAFLLIFVLSVCGVSINDDDDDDNSSQ